MEWARKGGWVAQYLERAGKWKGIEEDGGDSVWEFGRDGRGDPSKEWARGVGEGWARGGRGGGSASGGS